MLLEFLIKITLKFWFKKRGIMSPKIKSDPKKQKCGLCGKTKEVTKTDCCNQWICNDSNKYVMFSYARNSCYRNHSRFTLCGFHHNENHQGDWKTCDMCKVFETEIYAYYGTNEYNFEKLENPPSFEPTCCKKCGGIISLALGGYSVKDGEYWCFECSEKRFQN